MTPAALIHKTRLTSRRLWGLILAGAAAVILVGLAAPFIDASRYGERIRQTLENTLGRTVQFEAVHFTLFSGPGFSLERVTIGEDPRYGIEPFAFVPEMQVRVRPDKLILREIQISSLRLIEPSLNLVKRGDGTWNALELVRRLSAPRRMPLNFFPVFEVLRGRLDFKFGTRKTTLYMLNSDLQVYPAHSNTLNIQFSGSPARTDRGGNEFGHLHGTVNWILNRRSERENQLDADLTLDPSNLSEITTLVEGHDVGVHGTVSSHARIEGLLSDLRVHGQLHLGDLHRWDLLPASGNDWQVRYGGNLDLVTNRLALETLPEDGAASPVTLQMAVSSFLTSPRLSLSARLAGVPADRVLPLGRRMGMAIPPNLTLSGSLSGEVTLNNDAGLAGNVVLENAIASLPDTEPLRAERTSISLVDNRMLFRPTKVETASGALQIGSEVWLDSARSNTSVSVSDYPVVALKRTLAAWIGSPDVLASITDGNVTGGFEHANSEDATPVWSGKVELDNGTLRLPGLAAPLSNATGRVSFNGPYLEVNRLSALVGNREIQASYRYNALAKRTERLHFDMPTAELSELETLLLPTIQGQGWLARFGMTARPIPAWLAHRDMDVDFAIRNLMLGNASLGSLTSQVTWQGTTVRILGLHMKMVAGSVQGRGTTNLAAYRPRFSFTGSVQQYPWRGGAVDASGELETFGLGDEMLRNLQVSGTLTGSNLRLNAEDLFPLVTGSFRLLCRDGWPDLRLSNLQVADREVDWSGTGASQSDGRLVFELEHAGQQRRVVSALTEGPDNPALVAAH